jgi:ribonuclease HII
LKEIVVGIDEAGRGPLAGRVYAGAVILDEAKYIDNLTDSKKLSHKERICLYDEIRNKAVSFGVGFASVEEIDRINILQATFLAMRRALDSLNSGYDYVLVDGNVFPFKNLRGEAIVKGDGKVREIMAASIAAKVERDLYMMEMSKLYPQYEFDKHKGYPTKRHVELLLKYGASPIHRKTFGIVKETLQAVRYL